MPFRVTSRNWQESDRLLAGIMTAFGAPTRAIPIDGVGEFDGVMLGAFRRPRIEGRFTGDRDARVGRDLGRGRRRLRRREQLRQRQPRGDARRLLADGRRPGSSRSAIRARTAAKRSTRACASTERPVADLPRRRSISRTTTSMACCPATSTSTASTRGRIGFGRHGDRARHRLRRAVRGGDGVAALRR